MRGWAGDKLAGLVVFLLQSVRVFMVQDFINLNLGSIFWILEPHIWVGRYIFDFWRHIFEFRHLYLNFVQNSKNSFFSKGMGVGGWVPRISSSVEKKVPHRRVLPLFFCFFLCFLPPHSQRANYIRNAHRWCAVISKPRSTRLEGTSAMDHGINAKRIHM